MLCEVIFGETSENRAFTDFGLADDEDFRHEVLFVDVDHRGFSVLEILKLLYFNFNKENDF